MKKITWLTAFFLVLMVSVVGYSEQAQAAPKTYTITPTKNPIDASKKYKNYNSSTKHYYLLKSYLERIEKNGGGTLVLKKGTYTLSAVLNIPSNTTIKLEDGAILKKSMTTGKASFKPSIVMMQLVTPKNASKKAVMKKHDGAKNIKIIGSGKAIIDLNNSNKATAINMAHANNISISGIEFKNSNKASMIHVVGSKKVSISKNKFSNAKKGTIQPTIRLESAAKTSSVFPMSWSANDNTVNSGITVSSNTFTSLPLAIRTSDYVKGKYQTGVVIDKNKFSKMTDSTIVMTGWEKPRITSNTFDDTKTKVADTIQVLATNYPVIKSNTFKGSKNIIGYKTFTANKKTIDKKVTKLSATNKTDLATNQGTKLGNYFLVLPDTSYVAIKNNDPGVHNYYEFSSKTKSLNAAFTRYGAYNATTKDYYVLRSILERLEIQGGGKVKIKKGTYSFTSNLYVPSNVEIELEDGVILKKAKAGGSIFQLVAPSKSTSKETMKKHSGAKNIKFVGKGKAIIDLNNLSGTTAINMAHANNVSISGIEFKNNNKASILHVYGSKKIAIKNNKFLNAKSGTTQPTIRLETASNTKTVYPMSWSANDNTLNDGITVSGNTFTAQPTAIRTSDYVSGKYQTGIIIDKNKFSKMSDKSIVMTAWDKPKITNNTFNDKGTNAEDTIAVQATKEPTIKTNKFSGSNNPIGFNNFTSNSKTISRTKTTLTSTNKTDLATNEGTTLDNYFLLLPNESFVGLKNNDALPHNHYVFNSKTEAKVPSYTRYSAYNSEKSYYVLRSMLELLEVQGGGKLTIEKGTYAISKKLYVPSNVEIVLEDGVTLKKAKGDGSIFQLVPASKSDKIASMTKYSGVKNVKFVGKGKAVIDLNSIDKATAINMAHVDNVSISGIEFKNNKNATIVHVYGSKKVAIKKNKFLNAKSGTEQPSIRLETAAKTSAVYPMTWSANDKTLNSGITISGNTFTAQPTAIRTSDYVKGKYQSGIVIDDNKFSKMSDNSIVMTGWEKPVVSNNTFNDTGMKAVDTLAVRATNYPVIKTNEFAASNNAIGFNNFESNGKEMSRELTKLSNTNKDELATNSGTKLSGYFLLLPDERFAGLKNKDLDPKAPVHYVFDENSDVTVPYYKRYTTFNDKTKKYYVLRSMLEVLEEQKGGKLTIKKGKHLLTNNLFVPSNVEIELEDGVTLKKATSTGIDNLNLSQSIIHLVPPSKAHVDDSVGGHNGTQNVKIYSKGRATIDLSEHPFSLGIIMGHNMNVEIKNINFINGNGAHYIELDASKNVVIDNAKFVGNAVKNDANSNEAINLDTPDAVTKGFNSIWSNLDRTGNDGITIKNSHFENVVTAIGTHQISGEGTIDGVKYESQPHKNVKIINNTIKTTRSDAIHAFNWQNPLIEDNTFINVAKGHRGILSSGSYHPTFKNNKFENLDRPIEFFPKGNGTNGKEYKKVYDVLTDKNKEDLTTNTGKKLQEYDIKIYSVYDDFTSKNREVVDIQKLD